MPPNDSNVLEDDGDSSGSVSAALSVSRIWSMLPLIAPLTVPHLYWHAMAHGSSTDFPVLFNMLIDHSSHLVLINELFTC
jgi:hypothetical protein